MNSQAGSRGTHWNVEAQCRLRVERVGCRRRQDRRHADDLIFAFIEGRRYGIEAELDLQDALGNSGVPSTETDAKPGVGATGLAVIEPVLKMMQKTSGVRIVLNGGFGTGVGGKDLQVPAKVTIVPGCIVQDDDLIERWV